MRSRSEPAEPVSGSVPRSAADSHLAFRRGADVLQSSDHRSAAAASRIAVRDRLLGLILLVGWAGVELDRDDVLASNPEPLGAGGLFREPVVLRVDRPSLGDE